MADIYSYSNFDGLGFILLDSMFHFGKKEREQEVSFLNRLIDMSNPGTLITVCIQKTGNKSATLNSLIENKNNLEIIDQTELVYNHGDKKSNHSSETKYSVVTIKRKNRWTPQTIIARTTNLPCCPNPLTLAIISVLHIA